jgi:hypothetical protein
LKGFVVHGSSINAPLTFAKLSRIAWIDGTAISAAPNSIVHTFTMAQPRRNSLPFLNGITLMTRKRTMSAIAPMSEMEREAWTPPTSLLG